jgi:glycogen debranching enzyme
LLAYWLLDSADTAGATRFLAQRGSAGARNGDTLMRNVRFVLSRTAGLSSKRPIEHLIGLAPGSRAGNWRDSENGLAGGRFPYDVNGVLVPAALDAIERLAASGLLRPYLESRDREALAKSPAQREGWLRVVPPLFDVRIAHDDAVQRIRRYAQHLGIDPQPSIVALHGQPVEFSALALDAAGRALPVMHSDESFALLLGRPSARQIDRSLDVLLRPFPSGLLTSAGLLVANPAYADSAIQARFTRNDYHGTAIWAWQQALLAAGLERQLARRDLLPVLRGRLQAARSSLWRVIQASNAFRGSELWSWSYQAGRYQPEPFQTTQGDLEADAAQLWSTVFLALR